MLALSPGAVKGVLIILCSSLFFGCAHLSFPDPSHSPSAVRRGNRLHLGELSQFKHSMSWPVRSKSINSQFGKRGARFHEGLDLKASRGEPVFAAHGGKVVYSGRMRGYGKVIIIRYGSIATLYAHNNRNLVSESETVRRGEVIAEAGDTGRVSGPHLHFEVRVKTSNGKYVAANPNYFLRQ